MLGKRVGEWYFDRVISSPLERTRRTAESFADGIEIDESFIEIDLGRWEGKPFAEIQAEEGEELDRAIAARTIPMGGTGESLLEAGSRAIRAVDRVFESMNDGDRVAVVTHGGFLQSVLHRHMAGGTHRAHSFTENTAITRVVHQFGMPRLATFNDLGHLGPDSSIVQTHLEKGDTVVALVRHGQTRANVEGRWQGQGDWDLDDVGQAQAAALGQWWGRHETVYTSPLKRAASTASQVALNGSIPVPQLMEINMGLWEGMTTDEILKRWPNLMEKIYRHGVDLKRGETGESWGELVARFASGVGTIEKAKGDRTVVVAHGGAIRGYVASLTKNDDTHAESLFTPANTSVSHVAMTSRGPEILDYAVAPHLETLQ
jgi:broad specificity phosphatase PhoE